jgi:hypothetical protein
MIVKAFEDAARAMWAEARRMEAKGNDETVGLSKMGQEDANRAMARQGFSFGQSVGFERAAWMLLARAHPKGADINFFTMPEKV